ncbi:MAG: DNA repair ATPase [Bacteroidota bacterium]
MAEAQSQVQLETSTYELIQRRLRKHGETLRHRMDQLNQKRKDVFGSVEFQLIATDRITTENNCTPRDMVSIGDHFIFGYNVHIGLRTEMKLKDVFAVYRFEASDHSFHQESLDLLDHPQFQEDFYNLYKYYKDTVFAKFAVIGPNLFMVFQVGRSTQDIKTFKWAISDEGLIYLGNRFDHEFKYPDQHEFRWTRASRDMQRRGVHPHISIMDKVFVETVGGDLTIKVEDNTDSGQGIYAEPVDHPDQTLDDAEYYYADLGNLVVLKIRPYQEKQYRYLIFNGKMNEVLRVDSIEEACVLLPDDQGIIFSNGYYLQTGEYKLFDKITSDLHFEKRISSSNGEDFLYIFYNQQVGIYVLLPYNIVAQAVDTPIICSGFSIFPDGELCYFRAEDRPGRHHVVQVWQTPYGESLITADTTEDSWLAKVGNKDLVRGMAECNEMLTLLNKEDSYGNLYVDLVKKATDVLDSYYWIGNEEAFKLNEPLKEIKETAASAIDEFEKVRKIRENTRKALEAAVDKTQELMDKIRRHKAKDIDTFVHYLAALRALRGEWIGLKDLRYIDMTEVDKSEAQVAEQSENLSHETVAFLLDEHALQPYFAKVEEAKAMIEQVTKVTEGKEAENQIQNIGSELELLIDIVSNLNIDDATQTTRIIDNISGIYGQLNGLRANLKKRIKELQGTEATAEFNAQLKLLSQGLINYLDLCDTPEKCDEYLTKLMIQVEELEGKFSDYEEFVDQIGEQREEIYNAFETRKLNLVEARNKRANSLMRAAERILKGIQNRVSKFGEANEINAYFAADLMVEKVRDVIAGLTEMNDTVKAGDIQSRLKTIREDAIRQLKDRNELFVDGENIIKLGRHPFSVNTQPLDLTIVPREENMYFHLTGTNFFEEITDHTFLATQPVWDMTLPSENKQVYRAEFLAYSLWKEGNYAQENLLSFVQEEMSKRYSEGYQKGIHDQDAGKMLNLLHEIGQAAGLLTFLPPVRACAQYYWYRFASVETREELDHRIKGVGLILQIFPDSEEARHLQRDIETLMMKEEVLVSLFGEDNIRQAAIYLQRELLVDDHFVVSGQAADAYDAFLKFLGKKKVKTKFETSIKQLSQNSKAKFVLIRQWVHAFMQQEKRDLNENYLDEIAFILYKGGYKSEDVQRTQLQQILGDMLGDHPILTEEGYLMDYHSFIQKMERFVEQVQPQHQEYIHLKKEMTDAFREELRLEEFRPRVLTSFVRNQLIDKLYLPIIGDNLAKQLGTVGEDTRTDRQGLLLLISPPGYGKTTLMEYVANRLGLIFMKVNGPAIGHQVTSLDPVEAPNAAAREELAKLNLALEMGDNVMLYLDDIQHCHPEFLQKFISLCDAQRKIEGVYKGRTRTYDLRGKKVAVVMAGNPYTESGEKFQIPDMLSNRADTYNLGDVIGDAADVFKLSYIENSLTSNPILNKLATRPQKDIYTLVRLAEQGEREGLDFESNLTPEEVAEYRSILEKMLRIRDVILTVNQQYIASAGQQDEYRTEPPFQLQGSYRNMNRLAEKIVPIMNEQELNTLIMSHYEREAQTLTTGAEANLLKFKQLTGYASPGDDKRWEEICQIYLQQKRLSADRMAQLVEEMGAFTAGLNAIKKVLEKGVNGEG